MNKEGNCISEELSNEKKSTKRYLTIWTVIYLICFPGVFWIALWSILVFDNPRMTVFVGLTTICLALCVPLSMLASIWKMWSKYCQAKYRQARLLWTLPFFVFALAVSFTAISQELL
jgi:hypothetical protein